MTETIPEDILSAFIEILYLGSVELKSIEQVVKMFLLADKFCMEVREFVVSIEF